DEVKDIDELNTFKWKKIDDTTLEVEVDHEKTVNQLVKILDAHKMLVQDIKPKSNRLEQLFLNLLNE
ncbi:MAG TPA: ABC transporter ATP-binding protein, partial [Candidatus Gracilibacteria bacterium]|nr:ABC transporter ATP-binding protein [Candidatus Gracilibacteria bacterium]